MTTTQDRQAHGGPRRADAGRIRLTERDIEGLILCAEHGGAPYDLLATALDVTPARLRAIVTRWRHAGYAATGRLGPGPAWCWLTPAGMRLTGLGYPATRPALARLAHLRAVLAVRLWFQTTADWRANPPWWNSERRIRTHHKVAGAPHRPDAEIHWPSLEGRPNEGQVWAVEVELTPKPFTRAAAIMAALLRTGGYSRVIYCAARPAQPVLSRAASNNYDGFSLITITGLPAAAYPPDLP